MNVFYKVVNKLEHYFNVALSNFSAKFRPPMVSNIDESLDILVKEKSSLIRFGDGEFNLMLNGRFLVPRTTSLAFQNADAKLEKRLVGILKDSKLQLHNCKIAIPYPFVDYKKCGLTENAIAFWSQYLKVYRHKIWKMINLNYRYLDTQLSRFYMDFADKSESTMEKRIFHLKQLWDQEDLLFVEGPNSKLGVGNDLFDNALSIERFLCPSSNAYSKYDEILLNVKKHANKKLVILALGPTATVLGYDLVKLGYRVLDLGHIDIEYSWYVMGATTKTPVVGRLFTEVSNTNQHNELHVQYLQVYESQIVGRIT